MPRFEEGFERLAHAISDLKDNMTECFQSLNETITTLAHKVPTPPRSVSVVEEPRNEFDAVGTVQQYLNIGGSEGAGSHASAIAEEVFAGTDIIVPIPRAEEER